MINTSTGDFPYTVCQGCNEWVRVDWQREDLWRVESHFIQADGKDSLCTGTGDYVHDHHVTMRGRA